MHSRLQTVQDADFVSSLQQQINRMGTDKAGSPGHQTAAHAWFDLDPARRLRRIA
jgi:hypothetical protein